MPNPPGWLYIYEYFPGGDALQGRWIAYKWELSHSGLWRLGPFTPESNEPEGEHIYNIWFYSDGQWAGEGPDGLQSSVVYWTYEKGQPVEPEPHPVLPPPPQAPPPPQEPGFLDKLTGFIMQPIGIGLVILVLALIGVPGFFLYRKYFRRVAIEDTDPLPDEAVSEEETSAELPATLAGARIALPNGVEIQLTGNRRIIGRGDLARALGLDDLGLISRRHFEIKSKDAQFYIQDLGSANGTVFNGTDIKGKGPIALSDDDVIEPAGIISLKFYVL
ncbi:FHA domain-containing protein [Chloroflexota bacterium]